jgi:hypothetical protein
MQMLSYVSLDQREKGSSSQSFHLLTIDQLRLKADSVGVGLG